MDKLEIQKLRDLPIEGVAERLGFHVAHHKSLCPFHTTDRHPSMSYHVGKNICRCFVCMDEAIGPVDLVMRYLNKSFIEACRWLADEHNVILTEYKPTSFAIGDERGVFDPSRYERFFMRPWLSEAARKFLFEERMLDPRVVSWCRLTSWQDRQGVNWLQIPYYDMEGRLIGVQNRNLRPSKSPFLGGLSAPRFRFPAGCSQISMYNMPMLKLLKPGDECWIAEGSSDCWSLLSDHKKAIAIASATLLQPKDKQLLQEITARLSIRWRMSPDADSPGLKLFEQLKKILPILEYVPLPEGCKDYSEAFVKRKKLLLAE